MSWIHEYPACVFTETGRVTRDFYVRHFAAEVVLDLGWYLSLSIPGCSQQLRFLEPDAAGCGGSNRPGLLYNVQVADVERAHQRLRAANLALTPIQHFAWGDRAFFVSDPNRVLLQVFAEGEPSAEFLAAVRSCG